MKRIALATLAALAAGCSSTHIAPYVPKHREYKTPESAAESKSDAAAGSLWRGGHPASMLFTDARALRENDLVVVKVEEIADAKRTADTDLTRNSQIAAQIQAFLNQVGKLPTNTGLDAKIDANLGSSFTGDGSTARTERLTATVPAIVRKVMPNGNLFIEGHRVVLVNAEEHHFYISGVVRPIDIDQENSVKSSMIADAEIEFTGAGVLTDNQRQGAISRFFSWIWPF